MSAQLLHPTALLTAGLMFLAPAASHQQLEHSRVEQPLQITEYVADSSNFHVVSAIVYGASEALLIDTQNRVSDAKEVADLVAKTGRHLKAIFLTHPDHDHFTGAGTILARFPGTPVYMTPAALGEFNRSEAKSFAATRARMGAAAPDSFAPLPLPSGEIRIDNQVIKVIPDLQGDVEAPTNSALWIESTGTLIAGDVVFNNVHPWLGASTPATRVAWRGALAQLAALHPRVVVPGHKPSLTAPDTPEAITFTSNYLEAYDAERLKATSADELIAAMKRRFPDATVAGLLIYVARQAFRS